MSENHSPADSFRDDPETGVYRCRIGYHAVGEGPDAWVVVVNDHLSAEPPGRPPYRNTLFRVEGVRDSISSITIAASRPLTLEELIDKLRSIWDIPKNEARHTQKDKGMG